MRVGWDAVTAGFFESAGIDIVEGRGFRTEDADRTRRVVVLNERLARLIWPDGGAVGGVVEMTDVDGSYEVVGVVADVRHTGMDETPRYALYEPYGQHSFAWNRSG